MIKKKILYILKVIILILLIISFAILIAFFVHKKTVNKNRFVFKDYSYEVYEDYSFIKSDTNENMFIVFGKNGSYDAYVEIIDDVDNSIIENVRDLKNNLTTNGYKVGDVEVIKIGNEGIPTLKYYGDANGLLAYLKCDDDHTYEITIYDDVTYGFNYDYLQDLVLLLKKAKNIA